MRPSQLLAAVLAMSSTSVALSGAFDGIQGLADAKAALYGRQDSNSAKSAPASSQAPQSTLAPSQSKKDDNKDSSTSGPAPSGSAASGSAGGSKVTTGAPHSTVFDPRMRPGGISMITPNAIVPQYYKVGDWVTFAWNYTSLSITPSAIDILASCTANQATYTIAVNQSADQTQVLWDTGSTPSGQLPFLTDNYMLMIYDAESSISATAQAGYLAPYTQFQFGMYTKLPYKDWTDFHCPTCNGAISHFEKMTITALLMTTGTTIGSLLYFTYTFGVW